VTGFRAVEGVERPIARRRVAAEIARFLTGSVRSGPVIAGRRAGPHRGARFECRGGSARRGRRLFMATAIARMALAGF